MRFTVTAPTALAAALLLAGGCSRESTRGALYESLRFTSDELNSPDPNYHPEEIPSYHEYRTRREQYRREREGRDGREGSAHPGAKSP